MDEFWGKVSIAVEKAGISTNQYQIALQEQEKTIIDFLKFNCYPDPETTDKIVSIKSKILSIYTRDISQVISKIEVYSHDLDSQIVESIFQLVQYVACAELTEDINQKEFFYNQTLRYIYFVKHMVQISLSKLIFKRIKMYKRNLKNFNHKGYYIGNESFDDITKSDIKDAKKSYKASLKKYRALVKISPQNEALISIKEIKEDIGLEDLLKQLESIVSTYEESYPKIVNNGYNMPLWLRIINGAIETVSFALLIYGFLDYFGFWNTIVSSVQNIF